MFIYERNNKLMIQFSGNRPYEDKEPEMSFEQNEQGKITFVIGKEVIETYPPNTPAVLIGKDGYDTLEDAVKAAKDGDEIVLTKDLEGAGIGLWADAPKKITINFDGHSYKAVGPAVGSTSTQTQAFHLEKGSAVTLKNGKIFASPASESNVKMLIQNYCDLVIDNMDLDCSDNNDIQYVCSNNFGSMTVHGNTLIASTASRCAFDCWFGLAKDGSYDKGLTVIFDKDFTGKVTGKMEYGAQNVERVPEWIERTVLELRAGTFEGAIVPSSNNFTFADANIKVFPDAVAEDASFDPFRVVTE